MRREEWWKGAAVGESEPRRRSKAVQTCTMSQGCYCPVHFFFSSCYLLFGLNFISCSGAGVCVHVRTSRELREGKRALSMSARLTYSVPTFFFFRLRYLRFWLASAERSVLQAALLKLKRQEGEQWGRLKSTPKVFFLLLVNRAFFYSSFLPVTCLPGRRGREVSVRMNCKENQGSPVLFFLTFSSARRRWFRCTSLLSYETINDNIAHSPTLPLHLSWTGFTTLFFFFYNFFLLFVKALTERRVR